MQFNQFAQFRKNKHMLLLGVILAAVAALTLFGDLDKWAFLGQPDRGTERLWFGALLFVGVIFLAGAWCVHNIPYREFQRQEAAANARAREKAERVDAQVATMGQRLQNVEARVTDHERIIVFGRSAVEDIDGAATRTLEAAVLDRDGHNLAYVVVYMFPDAAFWKYRSYLEYEDLGGRPLAFLNLLEQPAFLSRLRANQYLIGVGLESSAGEESEYAHRRAAHLCGALFAFTNGAVPTFGLDLGQHTGERHDRDSRPERRQRSVVLVGVRDIARGVQARPLLPEILSLVEIPGVDLRNYTRAHDPTWIETRDCQGPDLQGSL